MNAIAIKIVSGIVTAATRRKAVICGHMTAKEGLVEIFDEIIRLQVTRNAHKQPYFCLACIGAAATRCAWCARVIVPGNKVSLLTPYEGFVVPEHATVHSRDPLKLVGCMHPDCVDATGEECGTWRVDAMFPGGYASNIEYGLPAFAAAVVASKQYYERSRKVRSAA